MNKLISTWNPLREMEETQNRFNRFFSGGFPNRIGAGEIHSLAVVDWSPEVDISEDDHGYLLKADLPEMKKDDVKVTVEDGILSVSGERKVERKITRRNSIASNDALALFDAPSRCLKTPIARKSRQSSATEC